MQYSLDQIGCVRTFQRDQLVSFVKYYSLRCTNCFITLILFDVTKQNVDVPNQAQYTYDMTTSIVNNTLKKLNLLRL